jgi:hypothetical protein
MGPNAEISVAGDLSADQNPQKGPLKTHFIKMV